MLERIITVKNGENILEWAGFEGVQGTELENMTSSGWRAVFRCIHLSGCISRNKIFTPSLTKVINRLQGLKDGRKEGYNDIRIRDKGKRVKCAKHVYE